MLRQCFDLLNIYGRPPETIETLILGFALVLEDFSSPTIKAAFTRWIKTETVMPVPADIAKLCQAIDAEQASGRTQQASTRTPVWLETALKKPHNLDPVDVVRLRTWLSVRGSSLEGNIVTVPPEVRPNVEQFCEHALSALGFKLKPFGSDP